MANIPVVPTHFIISFLGLHWPVYFLFTSFIPMGFLLDPLGFLDQITTSLSLITFRVYWPLSRPIEFTNSFPGLHWPIYLFFTSFFILVGLLTINPAFQPTRLVSSFLYHFPLLTFSILLGFFYCWAFCQKMGINNCPCHGN